MFITYTASNAEYTIDVERTVTGDGEAIGHYVGNAEAGLFLAVTSHAEQRGAVVPTVGSSIQVRRFDGETYTSTPVEAVFTQDELFPSGLFAISA